MRVPQNIESIDVKDIRSSEHVSEKEAPLTQHDPLLHSLSIQMDDSSDNMQDFDMLGSESEEEQKQLKLLE